MHTYSAGRGSARDAVHNWISKMFWRTQKADIEHELQLPQQSEDIRTLQLTPIESQFYNRQHEMCAAAAKDYIEKVKAGQGMPQDDDGLRRRVLEKLDRLRRASNSPQLVDGVRGTEKVMTLTDIRKVLQKEQLELYEHAQRTRMAAENLFAGVLLLLPSPPSLVTYGIDSVRKEAQQPSKAQEEESLPSKLRPYRPSMVAHGICNSSKAILALRSYTKVIELITAGKRIGIMQDKRENAFPHLHALHNFFDIIARTRVEIPAAAQHTHDELQTQHIEKEADSIRSEQGARVQCI